MRDNAAQILSIFEQDKLGFFGLVELNWNNNHYFTDFPSDVLWNGNLYLSDSPIVGVDPVRYSNVVDREAFSFSMSALNEDMRNEVAAGVTNLPVKIYLIFTIDGVPQTGIYQTLQIYNGYVSKIEENINSEEKIFAVECTAPLSDLDAIGTLFTTKNGMSVLNPADTTFDQIQEGSAGISLKWGRK